MRLRGFFRLIFCILLPISVSADSLSVKSFFSRYANPGVSVGYAGNRPMLVSPLITLKANRFDASFIYYKSERTQMIGGGVSYSPLQTLNSSGRVFHGGLGFGYSYDQRAPEILARYTRTNLLAHLSSYRPGSHVNWKIQLGVSVQELRNLAVDLGSVQYQDYKVRPWAGFSLQINAFQLPEPSINSTSAKPINDTLSYHRKAVVARFFNPSIGLGFGSGYGEFGGMKIKLNLGRFQASYGQKLSVHEFQKYHVKDLGLGVDLFRIGLPKRILGSDYLHYVAFNFSMSSYMYTCDGIFSDWCYNELTRFSYVFGINSYKIDGRTSISAKLGIADNQSQDKFGDISTLSQAPMFELGFQMHLLKFREHAYLRFWEDPSSPMEHYKREHRGDIKDRFNNIFRPFASFGVGVNHAFGMAPAIGFEFWRLRFQFSAFYLQDGSTSTNLELLLIKLKSDNFITVGGSAGNYSYRLYFNSLHMGYSHKVGQRGSFEVQMGLGQRGYYFGYDPFPSFNVSYNLYLRKHKVD